MGARSKCCWSCRHFDTVAEYTAFFTENCQGRCLEFDEPRYSLDNARGCEHGLCDLKRVERVRRAVGTIPDVYAPTIIRGQNGRKISSWKPSPPSQHYGASCSQAEMLQFRTDAVRFADPATYIVDTTRWGDKREIAIALLTSRGALIYSGPSKRRFENQQVTGVYQLCKKLRGELDARTRAAKRQADTEVGPEGRHTPRSKEES